MKTQTENKPKLNVRLLRKIQKHILEEPRRLKMDNAVVLKKGSERSFMSDFRTTQQLFPACGTAACIAGWAVILSGRMTAEKVDCSDPYSIRREADDVLGACLPIGDWMSNPLFFSGSWPEPFSSDYRAADTPRKRAKIAAPHRPLHQAQTVMPVSKTRKTPAVPHSAASRND